jgi:hypothetical protein
MPVLGAPRGVSVARRGSACAAARCAPRATRGERRCALPAQCVARHAGAHAPGVPKTALALPAAAAGGCARVFLVPGHPHRDGVSWLHAHKPLLTLTPTMDVLSVGQASQDAVAGLRTLSAVPPGHEPPFVVGEEIKRGSNRFKVLKKLLGARLSPSEQARARCLGSLMSTNAVDHRGTALESRGSPRRTTTWR